MNTAGALPMPNQSTARGNQAMGEIGRNTWINGSMAAWHRLNRPKKRPSGMATHSQQICPAKAGQADADMPPEHAVIRQFFDRLEDINRSRQLFRRVMTSRKLPQGNKSDSCQQRQ